MKINLHQAIPVAALLLPLLLLTKACDEAPARAAEDAMTALPRLPRG